ncbi:bifunctional folylpolyglutamate synthase/dihydrofolate synthase [Desulforhopalus singaporensis]|uniref:Dihydrofolate synthase/folylpolyglutamate synthase n=1 Tax=Desulforhopalus singaporensis TaxID=91360 RepID=A0A1H0UP54_9BACT|nr:folylpolyglutamate synthase/dihydrofolate synthase family protein [Desulforhopalus singaporensis]SDP67924.1 dihydrofolate synthase / folylpolyglutamate synthase [Desulforhopalus singaporensis]
MTYNEVLTHLNALQMHKIKLGLGAMQSFLAKVGRPETRIKTVHLAGTNGKGSVCAALAEILTRSGYRVGVYTSPHLSSVRERFRIGSRYISEEEFGGLGTKICEVLGDEQITYFEFTTALGFLWFAESDVDLVLLETGMGGRLDATNVVTPLVSVITSISMDHEAYLGNSLEEIAGEKAGIIKPGVPVVSSATDSRAVSVIKTVCGEKNAPLYMLKEDFDYSCNEDGSWCWSGRERLGSIRLDHLRSGSPSLVQQENESVALVVLALLEQHGFSSSQGDIYSGIREMRWPGRMEYFSLPSPFGPEGEQLQEGAAELHYLLDGAHNPAGVDNLSDTLKKAFGGRGLIGIWGAMFDKDLNATLKSIAPLFDTLVITRPEGERSASPEQIYGLLTPEQQQKAECVADVAEALQTAQKKAGEKDLIVVGGSLYLIGAVRRLLRGELA